MRYHTFIKILAFDGFYKSVIDLIKSSRVGKLEKFRLSVTLMTMHGLTATNREGVNVFALLRHEYPNMRVAIVVPPPAALNSVWVTTRKTVKRIT